MSTGFAPAVRCSGEQQEMPVSARQYTHRVEQRPSCVPFQCVVTKDDAGPFGQCPDRGQQSVPQPLIGHQPEFWEGVVFAHHASYSGEMIDDAKHRLDEIRSQIAKTAKTSGRKASDVTLVAISKTHDGEAIRPLLAAGQRAFGENRVQEAQGKWPALIADFPGVELHLVGQLQSNKAEEAVALFDLIHSVDRPSLVTAIAQASEKTGRVPACFLQVNIGNEVQKGGCAVPDLPALLASAQEARLKVIGLMAVPPAETEAAPYFALLAKLARDHHLAGLSMGMSGDYETAVLLGATHVRIGSALFGHRA
jgi:PLP dependent protein